MVSTTNVIMTVHPVLVLLPILGFLVLPCAPGHLENDLRIVTNVTVENPLNCSLKLCPQNESCSKAIPNENECFLISCLNNTQKSSCENITNFNDLLVELSVKANDSMHEAKNQTDKSALPHESSGTNSSSNVIQPLPTEPNILTTRTTTKLATLPNKFTTIAPTNLQTTLAEKASKTAAVPKPTIATSTQTTPVKTSTTTTTPKPTTTTSPKPSPTNTSTTTTSTTVAQTTIPKQPSPSPSVPTTPSTSTPSAKPIQTSPAASPAPSTMPKTSLSPSLVASTLPKAQDIPKRDQAIKKMPGDPLTSHLLNTSSLLAVLLFGLLFFVVTVALFLKQAYESYRRKDYTQVDYLINGMYSDSGV
ncbi:uncharacterized protein C11orf24 homolog [Garra rufa]|uniref:uncharacterized protein C11orf24 homolog n=1 Tax=Garra rufa TaxID=137080 RepID=UPI003CCEC0E0